MNCKRLHLLFLSLATAAVPVHAATFVVDVTHDNASDCTGVGSCTLRGALADAAANPGMDRIEFALAQNSVIAPLTAFTTINHQVIIDARPNPEYDGHPWVYLDGLATTNADGLRFGNGAASSAVYGIGFVRWGSAAIELTGTANQVRIDACYFGRTTIGGVAGNDRAIAIYTDNNIIGQQFVFGVGYTGAGNLIIGSSNDGILINGDGNVLRGNNIGGTIEQMGNAVGIRLLLANNNIIGDADAGNTIVYSTGAGILVNGNGNRVRGNHIGTNGAGSVRPNGGAGIEVSGTGNIIGGTVFGERNVIAFNATGVLLGSPGAAIDTHVVANQVRSSVGTGIRVQGGTGNLIEDNLVDGSGTGGVGDGVRVDDDNNTLLDNRIGSLDANSGEGVFLSSTANGNTVGPGNTLLRSVSGVKVEGSGNTIIGNTIGRDGEGNALDGVWLLAGATGTRVEQNSIDGNGVNGITLEAASCTVEDNAIGLEQGNGLHGIRLTASSSGTVIGPDNRIGNNILDGVVVTGTGNHVLDNMIGWQPSEVPVGNQRHGIHVLPDAVAPRMERNRILDNGGDGIHVTGGDLAVIRGNEVGGYPGTIGYVLTANEGRGIYVAGADGVAIGDGSLAGRNLVLFSGQDGIAIASANGTLVDGNLVAGNLQAGIGLYDGAEDTLVFRNDIRENFGMGIHAGNDSDLRNTFRNNTMADNVSPGIDLFGDGPSANDAGDADEGPNRMQNSPVLLFHAPEGAGLQVGVSVDSDPANSAYPLRIEFYASETPTGGGPAREGNVVLGSATYSAPGVASLTVAAPPASSEWLLALATDDEGNTSEFSAAIALVVDNTPGIFADGFED